MVTCIFVRWGANDADRANPYLLDSYDSRPCNMHAAECRDHDTCAIKVRHSDHMLQEAQANLAQTSLARELGLDDRVKINCVHSGVIATAP
jgi:hypothetical protein